MLPIVYANVGNPITFDDIAAQAGLPNESDIKSILQIQIKEHYSFFGTEPYQIEYCRDKDCYQIRPKGVVGRICCGTFVLEISSKFRSIELGKWLQMAHYCGANNLIQHKNDVAESAVSERTRLSGIDYFVVALVSAVYDCVNEGLIYEKGVKNGDDPNFRGKLNLKLYLQKSANPLNLQTTQNIRVFDCNANAIIKKALEVCVSKAASANLRGIASDLLRYFTEVNSERVEAGDIEYEYNSTLPRLEYKRALAISKIILEGFSTLDGQDSSFLPYYTINLDLLFEKYVSFELQKVLREENFTVHLQAKMSHPLEPELKGNFISPDILISAKKDVDARQIVIDTKNKYSMIIDSGKIKVSNQDLFQMVYYCQAVNTNVAILVYPGDESTSTSYPLLGSENKNKYSEKRNSIVTSMFNDGGNAFRYSTKTSEIYIIVWRINLSGTLHESKEAIAQLSQFIADCIKGEIL